MSVLLSGALQSALYTRLSDDPVLAGIVGVHVYDAVPAGPLPDLYVLLGEEAVKDASDKSGAGAVHDLLISVMSTADSFLTLKQAASAIWDALSSTDLALSEGRVVGLWFASSNAKRSAAGQRKIDLKFRARVEA
ncbi:DUF3168 domain-containing protein [Planktotalea arctica]|uniref:DUF3168 domain-containing protein n=1 Tax=Planktotalea arctica TaxID=1481893 RepID=UPI000A16FEBD|nr:DUF3168 domain-containing protein [Planktotalea arctica]